MNTFTLGLFLVICMANFAHGIDYCKTSCGTDNVGCNNEDTLKAGCPKDAKMVKLSATEKQLILNEHNDYRNAIANGSVTGFDKAARMAKMVWNDKLEFLAGLNTRNCVMAHDPCRNTDEFKMVGQNLGIIGASPNKPNTNDAIRSIILSFFNEHTDTTMDDIRSFRGVYSAKGKAIGHFTQLIWSNSTAVGCGATCYQKDGFNYFLMACNYAVGNVGGWPVYLTSKTSGSSCKTGTDSKFKALCTNQENIDPNNFYQA